MIEYRLFFQRRSGGHAIVEWIASHFNQSGALINSLRPKVKWNLQPTKYWNVEYPIGLMGTEKALKKYEKGCLRLKHKFVTTTFEDPLRYFTTLYKGKIYGVCSDITIPIIVHRDAYNHFVSRLQFDKRRKKPAPPGWYEKCIPHWKQMISNEAFKNLCVTINYNDWFRDKTYRAKIAKKLMLPNNDGRLNLKIHSYGGGSSFTGVREEASYEKITTRWKEYIKANGLTPKFKRVLNDIKLRKFHLSKFGWALNRKGRLIK